jgi:hypothetical protein
MIQSRTLARLLPAIGAALMALALLAPGASAKEPAPGYTQFAGCPSPEEAAGLSTCIRSEVTGGFLQTGKKTVPIENPLTISGGLNEELEGFTFNSKGGLTVVKQKVPGGVLGLTGLTWLLEFLGSEALTLYAATELAGTPTEFEFNTVTLPIKVHLINSILGNNCYLGSNSNPIVLHLTTETTNPPPPNKPITGKEPEFHVDANKIAHFNNGIYVDNSFAVPGASGCTLTLFGFIPISLNGLVNEQVGLPSAAGKNSTEENFSTELAARALVYP